jgi:hypothetical protein
MIKKVLGELNTAEAGFDKRTAGIVKAAEDTVEQTGAKAMNGHRPTLSLTKDDDTSKNIADGHQDFGDLDSDLNDLAADMLDQLKNLGSGHPAEQKQLFDELKQSTDELLARAKEVSDERSQLVQGSVYSDMWDHLHAAIKAFYKKPAAAPKKAAPVKAAAPKAAAPVRVAPKAAAPVHPASAAVKKAAPATKVAAKAYATDSSSGSIFSALMIIGSVVTAAGATLYCIGGPKYRNVDFLTRSGQDSELDRLFVNNEQYYQSDRKLH